MESATDLGYSRPICGWSDDRCWSRERLHNNPIHAVALAVVLVTPVLSSAIDSEADEQLTRHRHFIHLEISVEEVLSTRKRMVAGFARWGNLSCRMARLDRIRDGQAELETNVICGRSLLSENVGHAGDHV